MTPPKNGKRAATDVSANLVAEPVAANTISSRLRPFRQGSLDSYCGLYAIANALLRLKPDWFLENDDDVSDLFYRMMKGATRLCSPGELCAEGLDGNQLEEVARVAMRHMKKIGHRFELLRPGKALRKFRYQSEGAASWLAAAAQDHSLAVILHIEEREYNHWSILKSVRGNRVYLFDSDNMVSTHVDRCEPWLVFKWIRE